ncbi:MAG: hypothetical protein KGI57_03310, partial [Hyphomicrobiales bacterium]|nr:hypothetical protein [Hyphomicrobiales bacterium]MDE2016717.1 hypothetical protein [Hyphomicrobiales bacterium]
MRVRRFLRAAAAAVALGLAALSGLASRASADGPTAKALWDARSAVSPIEPPPPMSAADAATVRAAHGGRDIAYMRRNHMKLLYMKRDMTVYQGVRTPEFSIAGCVSCHVVKDSKGVPVTAADPRHFCRACHLYAAVQVDCFECHASRPGQPDRSALATPTTKAALAALDDYLRTTHP